MTKIKDLIGHRYGKLLVTEYVGLLNHTANWKCVCDCGNASVARGNNLTSGKTKSCGCTRIPRGKELGSKEYTAWCGLKSRCINAKNTAFKHYGGRGITVCNRWLESYEYFLEDMGRAPSPLHSIDRIDTNGNYEPSNCRWATWHEQAGNRNNNIIIEIEDRRMNLTEWCRELKLNRNSIVSKIRRGVDTRLLLLDALQ